MTTLFISDLHLDGARPELIAAFERFCADDAREARRLFILGDLFEAWIGDDDHGELSERVAKALRPLSERGCDIAFQHGNRDFLVGEDYARRCGMRLLPEEIVIEHDGQATLLMHGDTLCTRDVAYQAFRRQTRDPRWQSAFLAKPLRERQAFAAHARAESLKHTRGAEAMIMDVEHEAVVAAMRRHGVRALIHGHTHRPATHYFDLEGDVASRRVLPDW